MTMNHLDKFKKKLAALEGRRNAYMRSGQYIQSMNLNNEIERIRKMIETEERYMTPRLLNERMNQEEIDRSGVIPAIIVVHLAADFLTACCYEVEDILKKLGITATSVVPDVREIRKTADRLASSMGDVSEKLEFLIINNETLNEALLKKVTSYMISGVKKYDKEKAKQSKAKTL